MDENDTQDVDLNNDEGADDQMDDTTDTNADEGADKGQSKEKPKRTPEEQLAWLEGRTKRLRSKLGLTEKKPVVQKEVQKTGELDDTQLDYLDLKGISEAEDIKIVEDIVKKTGMTVRQALKDDYVLKKLGDNKANREVKDATPGVSKRGGGNQGTDLAIALAKYESSGYKELPKDFALRSAVINATANKQNPNKPSWHD